MSEYKDYAIPTGHDHAITTTALCNLLHLTPRELRRYIQYRREQGELIINRQDGKGYYVADAADLDDIEAQYRQDTSRAMAILRRRKALRSILREAGRL